MADGSADRLLVVAIFSLSFFFFGHTKNLGICEATKDRSGSSSRNRKKEEPLEELQTGTDFRCSSGGCRAELRLSRFDSAMDEQEVTSHHMMSL